MRSILTLVAVILICSPAYAQELPAIQTDRPDQTECPFIVPAHHFQMENGFSYERIKMRMKTFLYPSSLAKYGISDRLEARLVTEFNTVKFFDHSVTGFNPIALGFKANFCKEHGIIPTTSVIFHLAMPEWSSAEFRSTLYAPSFRFTMQHTLSDRLAMGYNVGAEWDGEVNDPIWIYTFTIGCSFTDKIGGYIELYGFAPEQSMADHRFDGGINYLLKKNILLDISGGAGLTDDSPDYYAAVGFSFRLKD